MALGLDQCKTAVTPSQFGQKEKPDEQEGLADRSSVGSLSCIARGFADLQLEINLVVQHLQRLVMYAVGKRDHRIKLK